MEGTNSLPHMFKRPREAQNRRAGFHGLFATVNSNSTSLLNPGYKPLSGGSRDQNIPQCLFYPAGSAGYIELPIMSTIPGFWEDGPHDPIPVEASWREFVRSIGGTVLEDVLPKQRQFENADFAFLEASVVVELKEIETEFSSSPTFRTGFDSLMRRLMAEDPNWRPALFDGSGKSPKWFTTEFVRLFRAPLSRVLKKANRQLRETKDHLKIQFPAGILLLVNDGFTAIGPDLIRGQISELLTHSYSSIDCFIYLTVNRYVEIAGSNQPRLLWVPTYSDRASDERKRPANPS